MFKEGEIVKLLNTTTDLFDPIQLCEFRIVRIRKSRVKLICLQNEQELFCSIEWLKNNLQ